MSDNWQRSTFCSMGDCVEVNRVPGARWVRSSLDDTTAIRITDDEWAPFVAAVRAGQFD